MIQKISALGNHIKYLQSIMDMIEASYCFDSVNATQKVNIAILFAKTRNLLLDVSSKISTGLQQLDQEPSTLRVFNVVTSIFNDDSYDSIHAGINLCIQVFENYLENKNS